MSKPAFPVDSTHLLCQDRVGMTMRQWYKGMALAYIPHKVIVDGIADGENYSKGLAKLCGVIADAMLKEDKCETSGRGAL